MQLWLRNGRRYNAITPWRRGHSVICCFLFFHPNYSLFAFEFCDKHMYDLAAATMHVAKLTLRNTLKSPKSPTIRSADLTFELALALEHSSFDHSAIRTSVVSNGAGHRCAHCSGSKLYAGNVVSRVSSTWPPTVK